VEKHETVDKASENNTLCALLLIIFSHPDED